MKEINYPAIIERLQEQTQLLTDWEADFIYNVSYQMFPLTQKQKEVVLSINRKVMKGY